MRHFFTFIAAIFSVAAFAGPVDSEQARKKAEEFFATKGLYVAKTPAKAPAKAMTQTNNPTNAAYYVFNAANDKGFVIVSGDDRTDEILGYTTAGQYDEEQLPPNMKAWLQGYVQQIEMLDKGAEPSRALAMHPEIEPLVLTKWNQGSPYNGMCPVAGGFGGSDLCVTGCVATAMAQVMYYHRWPQDMTEAIPGYRTTTTRTYLSELEPVRFNWDGMKFEYDYGETDGNVATLMRYCGQSIEMDYCTDASSAYTPDVVDALKNYFDYDKELKYLNRSPYTVAEWDGIIYNELENNRPVLYSGRSTGGGHAFVCDGYDGNGLYHINWGWGGYCDGYFKLSVLNPYGGGIGSSSTSDGYAMAQGAIVGICPPTGVEPELKPLYMTATDLQINETNVSCGIWNYNAESRVFSACWAVMDNNNNFVKAITSVKSNMLQPYYGWGIDVNVANVGLEEGSYRIVPVSREDGVEIWKSALPTNNYVQVDVDADGNVAVTLHPIIDLEVVGAEFTRKPFVNTPQEVVFTVKNNGDECNHLVFLFVSTFENERSCVGQTNLVIEEGETDQLAMYFNVAGTGTYNIWLATDQYGNNVIGQTALNIREYDPELDDTKLTLDDLSVTIDGNSAIISYTITNEGNGDFNSSISLNVYDDDDWNHLHGQYKREYIAAGETKTFSITLSELEEGRTYSLYIDNYDDHGEQWNCLVDGYSFRLNESTPKLTLDDISVTIDGNTAIINYTITNEGEGYFNNTISTRCWDYIDYEYLNPEEGGVRVKIAPGETTTFSVTFSDLAEDRVYGLYTYYYDKIENQWKYLVDKYLFSLNNIEPKLKLESVKVTPYGTQANVEITITNQGCQDYEKGISLNLVGGEDYLYTWVDVKIAAGETQTFSYKFEQLQGGIQYELSISYSFTYNGKYYSGNLLDNTTITVSGDKADNEYAELKLESIAAAERWCIVIDATVDNVSKENYNGNLILKLFDNNTGEPVYDAKLPANIAPEETETFSFYLYYDMPEWYEISPDVEYKAVLGYSPEPDVWVPFENGTIILHEKSVFTQEMEIAEGWNWISTFIDKPLDVNGLFDNGAQRVVGQTQESILDHVYGVVGNIKNIEPGIGYKIMNSSEAFTVTQTGDLHDLEANPITLVKGWNWIGYPYFESRTIATAITNAEEGDCISGQDGYTEFADGTWEGNFDILQPGHGYLYKSASNKTLQFDFSGGSAMAKTKSQDTGIQNPAIDPHKYPNTMNVTAQLCVDSEPATEARYRIYAYCGDELRGEGKFVNGKYYITVYGDKPMTISFVAEVIETGEHFAACETLTFTNDIIGSRKAPLSINIATDATTIDSLPATHDLEIYNMAGAVVYKGKIAGLPKHLKGIFIAKHGNTSTKVKL